MFGSKSKYIKLTDKDIKRIEKNMSASEKRAFEKEIKKRTKQAEDDLFWEMVMLDTFLNG